MIESSLCTFVFWRENIAAHVRGSEVRTSSESSSEFASKSSESEFLDFRFRLPFFPAFSFFLSESSSSSESFSSESSEFLAFRFRPLFALSFLGLASISSISESESAAIRLKI